MKCSALLPQVALVLAVAYACSDSTSPAVSNAKAAVTQRASVVGKQPPPPISTAITITITPGATLAVKSLAAPTFSFASAPFTGKYFSNGAVSGSCQVGDPTVTFNGTAWLQLDNTQPTTVGTASANARFKAHDMRCTGAGTLMIEGHEVIITSVEDFLANPDCGVPDEPCAQIEFTATVDGNPGQRGHAEAFDKEFCTLVDFGEGPPQYICGSG